MTSLVVVNVGSLCKLMIESILILRSGLTALIVLIVITEIFWKFLPSERDMKAVWAGVGTVPASMLLMNANRA
jgi:hypothetical protein